MSTTASKAVNPPDRIASGDRELVRIVDAAVAEAARRSGAWLACRPGCTQCCLGPFPVNALDARRLLGGLAELAAVEPARARRVLERARRASGLIPAGMPVSEIPGDDPCPVLDPDTGLCELYPWRPMTCRTFGPPVRSGEDLGVCELCFEGAGDAEIAACEVEIDPDDLEADLLNALGANTETTIAQVLATAAPPA
jgi:Fe-S-cluster containining protein